MAKVTVGSARTRPLVFDQEWNPELPEAGADLLLAFSKTSIQTYLPDTKTVLSVAGSGFNLPPFAPLGKRINYSDGSAPAGTVKEFSIATYSTSASESDVNFAISGLNIGLSSFVEAIESGDLITVLLSGNDTIEGTSFTNGSDVDPITGVEMNGDFIRAGSGNDRVDAKGGNDIVYGERGNDTLNGGSGDDLLYGGVGNDVFEASSGNDTLNGGSGNDTYAVDFSRFVTDQNKVTISDPSGVDQVNMVFWAQGEALDAYHIPITRINNGYDLLIGYYPTSIDNARNVSDLTSYLIIKNAFVVNALGTGFVDTVDTLSVISLIKDNESDVGTQTAAEKLNLRGFKYDSTSGAMTGTAKNDILIGNDTGGDNIVNAIYAGAGNDVVFSGNRAEDEGSLLDGGAGNDELFARDGLHTLVGGLGADLLNGSDGSATVYKYQTVNDSTAKSMDTIADPKGDPTFYPGHKIDLSEIDADTKAAGNQTFAFATSATKNAVWFDAAAERIYADNTGDAKADLVIKIVGLSEMSASDFVL